MRKKFSFSLWLVPEGTVFAKLKKITGKFSRKFNSPKIRPHVTLLGGFSGNIEQAVRGTEKLARKVKPFTVKLKGIDYRDEFFRSLFLVARKSGKLMEAHRNARNIFGAQESYFMPHLSLLYGDFSKETKEQVIKKLGKPSFAFTAKKIHLVVNNERDMIWPEIAAFNLRKA